MGHTFDFHLEWVSARGSDFLGKGHCHRGWVTSGVQAYAYAIVLE